MADILDLVDVEELRNEVQKKYRAVAEKPEASSGYDRAILDQLCEEACEAFAGRRPRPPGRGSAFLSSLGPSRVRDSNREQPLRHSPPHTFRSSKRFWAILTRVVQTLTIGEPHFGNAATRHWHGSSGPQIKGDKMKRVLALGSALVVFGLTGTVGAAASPPSPAPCTLGALNMLHDATMATIPMTHDAAQGNAGMSTAVAVSGCK